MTIGRRRVPRIQTSHQVPEELARECLDLVREKFKGYLEPFDGRPPTCPEPELDMDWDGRVAILWEDGPSEWAYIATEGGSSEEERCLVAAAAEEFGVVMEAHEYEAVVWPVGVYPQPYFSFVLCLYP